MNFYDIMTCVWVSILAIPVAIVARKFYVEVIKDV